MKIWTHRTWFDVDFEVIFRKWEGGLRFGRKNKLPNKQTKKQLGAFYLTAKYNVDYTSKWSFENFVYHRTERLFHLVHMFGENFVCLIFSFLMAWVYIDTPCLWFVVMRKGRLS